MPEFDTSFQMLQVRATELEQENQRIKAELALLQAERERVKELERLNIELQQRDRLLLVVAQITKILLEAQNTDAAILEALRAVGEAANISRVFLLFEQVDIETGHRKHCVIHEWTAPSIVSYQALGLSFIDNEDFEALTQILHSGKSVWRLIDDLPLPARAHLEKLGIKSTGVVPIFIEGRYIGSIGFDDCITCRAWTQQEINVLTAAAESIGAALHRKLLVERLISEQTRAAQERAAQLTKANQVLKKTLDVLATEPKLDRSLGHVLKVTTDQLGSPSAALWLFNPNLDRFSLHLAYLNGDVIAAIAENAHLLTGQWIRGQDLSHDLTFKTHISKRVPVLYDVDTSPEISLPQRQFMEKLGVKLLLGVPLLLGTQIIGSFTVRFTVRRHFQAEELELVQALAHQATLVIQLLRLAEEAKQAILLEERNRMAREIHDTLAQGFAGVIMQLQAATRFIANKPDQAQIHITRAQNLATESLADARRSVWLLYEEQAIYSDLQSVITQLTQQMPIGTNVQIDIEVQGTSYNVNPEVGVQLTRIVQESLNNILRHAKAQNIKVLIEYELKQLQISIQDDGCGFEQQNIKHGFGLKSMQQRADLIGAQLQIHSSIGVGTQVAIKLNN